MESSQPPPPTPREQQRKSVLKDLKRKYALEPKYETAVGDVTDGGAGSPSSYLDRADERRRVHGIDPLHAKTEVASLDTAIKEGNRGYGLLQRMGWQAGSGLGRHGQGRSEPVPLETRPRLAGLGSAVETPALELSQQEKRKNEIWKKTRKRFKATPVLEAFAASSDDEEGGDSKGNNSGGGGASNGTVRNVSCDAAKKGDERDARSRSSSEARKTDTRGAHKSAGSSGTHKSEHRSTSRSSRDDTKNGTSKTSCKSDGSRRK